MSVDVSFWLKYWAAFKRLTTFRLTSNQLIVLVSVFFALFTNRSFFTKLLSQYPPSLDNAPFLLTIAILLVAVTVTFISLVCYRFTIKPVLIFLLITTALVAYFMDSYQVLIDVGMVQNILETNAREALDLLSSGLLVYLVLFGVLPAFIIAQSEVVFRPFFKELFMRAVLILVVLVTSISLLLLQSAAAASFFREHKQIRNYANPSRYLVSLVKLGRIYWRQIQDSKPFINIGEDALSREDGNGRDLVIVVVGETARADRFSLNGYSRLTNPRLEREDVISFTDVESCATSTAQSVPCMFSILTHKNLDLDVARRSDNVLDILNRAGAYVLWRDNNSSSKGVADRVEYEDFRNPPNNKICDLECRDVGMLVGLNNYVEAREEGDIVIVLHQMGNHGPAYYKRYPREFEIFKPLCETNELSECSADELNNTYDNAIAYTDYFLNQVVEFLKRYDDEFRTAMLYISDHGESLGEKGLFLHGMPNLIAPKEQRHVPMVLWLGNAFDTAEKQNLRDLRHRPFSHDYIFHSLLGLLGVETSVYEKTLDIFYHARSSASVATSSYAE